ncbi:kinase-like domain-containing protein [Trichoderma austrokoningii]
MFATVEDDMIHYGQLNRRKEEIPFQDASQSFARAPEELPLNDVFIKRPRLAFYDIFFEHKVIHLPKRLIEEAEAVEMLRSHPHPSIVRYHGCRVQRDYITGLSAIDHLHHFGWAPNDLNPSNILVAEDTRPVVIDFGSAHKIGEKLRSSRGTKGWIDYDMKDYTTSETRHDTSALTKLHTWLHDPTFED